MNETTVASPHRSDKPEDPLSPSSVKNKVAPLIHSRHEWLEEEVEIRRRQSIDEEEILRLKGEKQQRNSSRQLLQTSSSKESNNSDYSSSSTTDPTTRDMASQYYEPGDHSLTPSQADEFRRIIPRLSTHSMDGLDISLDSLDAVNREDLGNARRHTITKRPSDLLRFSSDSTLERDNTPEGRLRSNLVPLAYSQVADSVFWGFATTGITEPSQVSDFVHRIRQLHPTATHIPYAWNLPPLQQHDNDNDNNDAVMQDESDRTPPQYGSSRSGYNEDGEPEGSTGPLLLEQVQESKHETDGIWLFPEEVGGASSSKSAGTVVVVVRYFGSQLLGVTCGRLGQCYQRIAQTALHRLFRGYHVPLLLDFTTTSNNNPQNLYGLAAGDTELHLNVLAADKDKDELMSTLLDELDFDGFKGAQGEVLPRLQNLQADFYRYDPDTDGPVPINSTTNNNSDEDDGNIIPVYRYPGNYQGDEWETFPWSPTSLDIKQTVEAALPHFYNQQTMNHCVTNYYRHADDYIAHHGDKDLDLDKHAAIVSVSIGAARILELRRRAEPRDLTRVLLPHGSMLLLGPVTNRYFTHSILPVVQDPLHGGCGPTRHNSTSTDDDQKQHDPHARISLTMRRVTTYMDTKTRRLFGEGVECQTLQGLRRSQRWENLSFVLGFGAFWRSVWYYAATKEYKHLPLLVPASWLAVSSKQQQQNSGTASLSRTNVILQSVAQEGVVLLGSAAFAWWSYSGLRRVYHRRKEEQSAREFFTKKSSSGTKY
ncbi:isochorismatase family [Seminavis robusta]|uniref:Isochorismatase family n=1 Tax=Seminavis robusta TaxID=568900 RepID=A0A9N8ET10_9STRA|nr:isochorismatase family [Seminavis robusta]|eukprot:Sro1549_g281620.1 isochorismatase family (765) ;mRNA; r:3446-5740